MGLVLSGFSKPLRLIRSATLPGTAATLLNRWPCLGWGTLRVWIYSDLAGTLNFLQKPQRVSASSMTTMRQTDTSSIAAASGASIEFLITADYLGLAWTASVAPTVFELEAALYP